MIPKRGGGNGEVDSENGDDTTQNQTDDSLYSDRENDSTSNDQGEVTDPDDCDLVGVWGLRLTIEAMWGGLVGGLFEVIKDGRGFFEIYARIKIDSVDLVDGSSSGTIRVCGLKMPPFLSVVCEAYQPNFPDALWEKSSLQPVPFTAKRNCDEDGCTFDFDTIAYLLGLSMNDAAEASFPSAGDIDAVECENGVGIECFFDPDEDGRPGLMVDILSSNDTEMPGYGCNGSFKNRAVPLNANIGLLLDQEAWTARTDRIDLGIRAMFNISSNVNADCSTMSGIAQDCSIGLLSPSCMLKEGTRDIFTAPPAGPNQDCSETQMSFMNENLPLYRFYPEGEEPPDILDMPDDSPSKGSQLSLVKLGSLDDSVGCVDIREADY
jgi:hypothetical protein